jgi:glucose/arabinose dehydrogenase
MKILKILKVIGLSFLALILVLLTARAFVMVPTVWLESIAGSQEFPMAVHLTHDPRTKDHFIVTTKTGTVHQFKRNSETSKLLLDLSSNVKSDTTEEGMLSTVVDPKNLDTVYIFYSLNIDDPLTNRLSRFKFSEDGTIDPKSEEILIEYNKPKLTHNAGDMEFGEDGYLWISIGEGMYNKTDQGKYLDKNIQGSIIRIDVRRECDGKKYCIPSDNPFVNDPEVSNEVWARGLRNPWRWSFVDRDTIIAGDVGHNTHEEINLIEKGDHLGWPYLEGPKCSHYIKDCNKNDKRFKQPMTYFERAVMRSVTGGYVYRGSKIDSLKGQYVFADYLRGIMTVPWDNPPKRVSQMHQIDFAVVFPKLPMQFGSETGRTILIVSFLEDTDRELLAVAINGGIFKIVEIPFLTQIKAFFYMLGSFR